jgi:hypothetical protein
LSNDRSWVWWISPDKLNIINNDEIGIEYFYNKCESDLSKAAFNTIASELSLNIKSTMIADGFKYNQENSSSSITDIVEENYDLYDYIQAYEKEGTKCTLVANPDCSTSSDSIPMHYTFSFTCTDNYQKNYSEQSPYLKDLGIDNAIVHVANKVDNFVKLNINYRRTGSYAIVKEVNNVWIKIYSGQDNPGCNFMQKYQVPKEIYGSCWTDDTPPVLQ